MPPAAGDWAGVVADGMLPDAGVAPVLSAHWAFAVNWRPATMPTSATIEAAPVNVRARWAG
ncbi:hypothetical protein BH09ACT2_BH09ACT2_05160 [soil metagenome]